MDNRVVVITEVIKAKIGKHEIVGPDAAHTHKEIAAGDVPVESGMDGKGETIDADKAEEKVESNEGNYDKEKVTEEQALAQKHLPGQHDQQSHGRLGANAGVRSSSSIKDFSNRVARQLAYQADNWLKEQSSLHSDRKTLDDISRRHALMIRNANDLEKDSRNRQQKKSDTD